jgi:chromosome segregation ATPase
MARNRSHDPVKGPPEVQVLNYSTIVASFSLKLKALEEKYSGFVANCLKIIKKAQKFLDINLTEHLNSSDNQSSKFIENLNKQKVKLKRDLVSIEKMSFDLKNSQGNERDGKFLSSFRNAKEKILEKLEDHKARYFIQTVLNNLEDKVNKELQVFENFGNYYARLYEVEELLGRKTKEFEVLMESYNKLKGESEMLVTNEKKFLVTSPKHFSSGRTSPSGFSSKSRDLEIQKLQSEIQYLKEKINNLTGTAKKIVARKDEELQKLLEEKSNTLALPKLLKNFKIFDNFEETVRNKLGILSTSLRIIQGKVKKFRILQKSCVEKEVHKESLESLERLVSDLKEQLIEKEDFLSKQKEKFLKLNKLYSDLHEKTKIFNVRYDGLVGEMNEKNEIIAKFEEIRAENEKLRNYKIELDKEITELKDYFQSDIDGLSNKIEKLFGENLCLKQKNDELKDKYEKVMVEKEKILIQFFEKQESELFNKELKSPSSLALKQELKIASLKIESLTKENQFLRSSQKSIDKNAFKEISSLFFILTNSFSDLFNKSFRKTSEKLKNLEKIFEKFLNLQKKKVKFQVSDVSGQKAAEIIKINQKISMENEKLLKKCESYQGLITNLQQTCEKLTSQQDSLYKCPTCDSFSKIIKEKDERIKFLQKEVYTLGSENTKLRNDIQEIEFTFRDQVESKDYEVENKKMKHSRGLVVFTDVIKAGDSKNISPTVSDVDLTYTLEGTTIKSTHDINTPLSVSHDDIKDLEFIE